MKTQLQLLSTMGWPVTNRMMLKIRSQDRRSEGKNPRFSWLYPKWVLGPFWAFSSPPNQPQRESLPSLPFVNPN